MLKYIRGYENQFVLYSGITINNQYPIYNVRRNNFEDISVESGLQAGILKYDMSTNKIQYFAYEPPVSIESKTSTQNIIYFAYLNWVHQKAELTIYQLDCSDMSKRMVYTLQIDDSMTQNKEESGIWAIEMFGISNRYLIIAIPKLPHPSREETSLFSNYLLVDIDQQISYIIPDQIGANDHFINMETIEVINYINTKYLVFWTRNISTFTKEEIWKTDGSNMRSDIANQSLVVIELDSFIDLVQKGLNINESYVVTQCDSTCGFVSLSIMDSLIVTHKHRFTNNTSEVVLYDIGTKKLTETKLRDRFKSIFVEFPLVLGVKKTNSTYELYDTGTGNKLYETSLNRTIRFANSQYIISQNFLTGHVQVHDIYTKSIISEFIGKTMSFHYISNQNLIIMVP